MRIPIVIAFVMLFNPAKSGEIPFKDAVPEVVVNSIAPTKGLNSFDPSGAWALDDSKSIGTDHESATHNELGIKTKDGTMIYSQLWNADECGKNTCPSQFYQIMNDGSIVHYNMKEVGVADDQPMRIRQLSQMTPATQQAKEKGLTDMKGVSPAVTLDYDVAPPTVTITTVTQSDTETHVYQLIRSEQ
jgi:hypothetical protein